jgi:DNA-binding MarR family transcriptional regulator
MTLMATTSTARSASILAISQHLGDIVAAWRNSNAAAEFNALAGIDANSTEGWLLWHLQRHGEKRLNELAALLGIKAPGATKAAARLEARALVIRSTSVEDARGVVVSLTSAGRAAAAHLLAVGGLAVDAGLADLDEDEIKRFETALSAVAARVTQQAQVD